MEEKNKESKYSFAAFLQDLLLIAIFIAIIQACGCDICGFIGNSVGECVNAYKQTTNRVHPSDLR